MAPLLMYSDVVPVRAREALKAALDSSPEARHQWLESAARILHRETGLDCADVLELVGLGPAASCG